MSLASGARLGPYEIISALGAGGMGEVYRATDTHLKRSVAIKVLPSAVATDSDRLARFQREAEVLAALNHPNIAAIYGLEKTLELTALVMELVEGEDLSQHILRGPMPLSDALPIAKQIADALEAAHEQGIVHRDLKPANVKVRADGTVKVLDFGLAKALDAGSKDPASMDAAANSPTLTNRATQMGVILGTAAYMSPEQARGKNVDKRSDIWAFGVVLYEMLTGRPAFAGDTVTDIIAAVVTKEPDWSALPAATPPAIRQLLSRCQEKDVKRRLRDIGDARFVLEADRSSTSLGVADNTTSVAVAAPARRPWGWIAATALLALTTALFGALSFRTIPSTVEAGTFELAIAAPPDTEFQIGSNLGNVIVSPDGTKVAFVAATTKASTLWVRSLGADDVRSLSGTEGASYPFWSPDSKRIGFFAAGKLRTVDIAGGLPEVIADALNGRGGSWGDDDTILFSPRGGGAVYRVSAKGGSVSAVTTIDDARGDNAHYWPVLLPGGKRFIFFLRSTRVENGGIYLGHVDGVNPPVRLIASLSSGFVASRPSDGATFLFWVRDGDLLSQAFDTEAGSLNGEIVTVARDVRVETSQRLAFASASSTGVLAWAGARAAEQTFARYSRDGRRIGALPIPSGDISQPALSPDGRRLAFLRVVDGAGDVFVLDITTGAIQRISPSPDYDELPTWSRDGSRVFYHGRVATERVVFQVAPGGGDQPKAVSPNAYGRAFATADGKFIISSAPSEKTGLDLVSKSIQADGAPVPLLVAPGDQNLAAMSGDNRWVVTTEGTASVSLRRLIVEGGTLSLGAPSSLGLTLAFSDAVAIRRDGREVFALAADNTLKVVSVTPAGNGVVLGPPTTLFKLPVGDGSFDVNADGTEFILNESPFAQGQTLRVLTNWDRRLSTPLGVAPRR